MLKALVRDLMLIAVGMNLSLFAFGAFMGSLELIWLSGLSAFLCIFGLTFGLSGGEGSDDSKS
jgi:hypothetical protein